MTKQQAISEQIIAEFAKTGSMRLAIDAVFGEGAYDRIAGELYEELRK